MPGMMIRPANLQDIPALAVLEKASFSSDRLSRRSLRYMLTKAHASLLVAEDASGLAGYVLVLYSRGTSMARLYSIAVDDQRRGQGVGRALASAAEAAAIDNDCVSMRLEIRRDNLSSQALFTAMGYKPFKVVLDYYADHMDALRFEKDLAPHLDRDLIKVPYYEQTLDFTCGPAAVMMAMKALSSDVVLDRTLELRLWREATTIFMTAGHGGCGPYGLALALHRRGFELEVFVNEPGVFLVDSVRSPEKKEVMRLVQEDFLAELAELPVPIHHHALDVDALQRAVESGAVPVVLISSYRIYNERFPHWVVVTGFDTHYIYVHDPFVDYDTGETVTDSINMPIARREFQRMARYGKAGQKAVLLIRRREAALGHG